MGVINVQGPVQFYVEGGNSLSGVQRGENNQNFLRSQKAG